MTILICLAFYALGAISMGLFMVLMMAWHYARRITPKVATGEGLDRVARRRKYRDRPIANPTDYDVGMEAAYPRDVHDGSER